MSEEKALAILREKLALKEAEARHRANLPHKYGWKNYKWFNDFLETNNRTALLCAANQISKSSSQIRKVIALATEKELWPKYFRKPPKLFWYFYPTQTMATTEFRSKWVPDFLPKNEYKNHPVWGWKDEYRNRGDIFALHFNSGVSVYFKSFEQDPQALQASSLDYIAIDEEMPEHLWDELNFRRNATDGMLSMVFTATLGQEFWRKAIEPKPGEKELFPDAWKRQVSMFDCQEYDDGVKSQWTTERIHRTISMCRSDAEVQRRVYGKFVKDSGLKYQQFNRSRNVVQPPEPAEPPPHWVRYVGIDLGAGGEDNHPSTISFIAVKPDYRKAVVYKHWRGDKEATTMTDVCNRYLYMSQGENVAAVFYDYASKEFELVASRMGISVLKADKGHELGEQVLNALFRHQMLDIWDLPENEPIVGELMSLTVGVDKRKAKDDSVDSVRYGVTRIPWDWSYAEQKLVVLETVEKRVIDPITASTISRERDRRRMVENNFNEELNQSIDSELSEWAGYLDESF